MTCVPEVQCSGTLFANVCHARGQQLLVRFVEVGSVDSVIGAEECDSDTEYDTDSEADYDSDDDDDDDSTYQYQPTSTYSDNEDTEYCSDSDTNEECASSWIDEHSIHCVFERLKMA
jgi:hypothetical protein